MNDVDILMAALVAFRKEFMQVSCRPENHLGEANRPSGVPHEGIDPLVECMTIASACMKHFRINHLPDELLAIVPERGYDWTDTQSLLALKYLTYLEVTFCSYLYFSFQFYRKQQVNKFNMQINPEEKNILANIGLMGGLKKTAK